MPEPTSGAPTNAGQADNGGANDAPAPNPNDLATELTPAEEVAFVDRQLGITDPGLPFAYGVDKNEGANNGKEKVDTTQDGGTSDSGNATNNGLQPGASNNGEKVPAGGEGDEGKQPSTPETPVEEQKEVEQPTAPDLSDVFLEITDANGKEHKIGPNDPLPDDFVFKNDAQLAEFAEARLEMKGIVAQRMADFEREKTEAESKTNAAQSEQAQYASWDAEIADLVAAGALPEPKAKPGEANFMEDPGVKQVDAVFKFMAAQNEARKADGKPPIMSFGTAFTLYKTEQDKAQAEEKQRQDNEVAKKRAALIGGSSSGGAGGSSDGLYKQGSAGSIHDLDLSDLL